MYCLRENTVRPTGETSGAISAPRGGSATGGVRATGMKAITNYFRRVSKKARAMVRRPEQNVFQPTDTVIHNIEHGLVDQAGDLIDDATDERFQHGDTDVPVHMEVVKVPSRKAVNRATRGKNERGVFSKLLNHLRVKYFMHYRDHHFISMLVAEARSWLMKNQIPTDNPITFDLMALAVITAFRVNARELEFRAMIKQVKVQDNQKHLNMLMSGSLGYGSRLKWADNTLGRIGCKQLFMQPRSKDIV